MSRRQTFVVMNGATYGDERRKEWSDESGGDNGPRQYPYGNDGVEMLRPESHSHQEWREDHN